MKSGNRGSRTIPGLLVALTLVFLGACGSNTQVTTIQEASGTADGPYRKILVVVLLSSFDSRRYLETEVVQRLSDLGTDAVASTSMMNSKTPITRSTFVKMIDDVNADALLLSQLTDFETGGTVKTMRPETTVNFRPTYYYNVFSVETTEYLEPPSVQLEYSLVLFTELYSVSEQEPVWAIKAESDFVMKHDQMQDYSVYTEEADAIVSHLSSDGLVGR